MAMSSFDTMPTSALPFSVQHLVRLPRPVLRSPKSASLRPIDWRLFDSSDASIKFCVACRPLNQLKDLFDDSPGFRVQDWTLRDTDRVISERFKSHSRMRILLQQEAYVHAINLLIK